MKSYNYDAVLLGEYWNCIPNRPRIYHHTVCSTLLYGLREAIALFLERGGLESSWENHSQVTRDFCNLLESNGLEMFIDDAMHRCPSVVSIKVPDNIDPHKAISHAMNNYYVEISGGLGPTAGKIFRYAGIIITRPNLKYIFLFQNWIDGSQCDERGCGKSCTSFD